MSRSRRSSATDKLAWLVDQGVVRSWMPSGSDKVDVVTADGKSHLWNFRQVESYWAGCYAMRDVLQGAPAHRDGQLTLIRFQGLGTHLMTHHSVSKAMVHKTPIEQLANLHLIRHDMDLTSYRGNPEHEHPAH